MEFEWDEANRQSNIGKHGIDFAEAVAIYEGFVYTFRSDKIDYGEDRYLAVGLLNGIEITIVYTLRDEKYRIISVRRARIQESKRYYGAKSDRENGL